MKKQKLQTPSYRYITQSFREWLDVLGYAPKSIKGMTAAVREMLHYLEEHNITQIKTLDSPTLKTYYEQHLSQRPNKVRPGGLSNATLNEHITSLRRFIDYLRKVGRLTVPPAPFKLEKTTPRTVYLTEEEIHHLFRATYEAPAISPYYKDREKAQHKAQQLASRDRAMLAVYYGCGLRRNEGINLETGDINFEKSLLHVRKGKKNKQRYVPISKASQKHLQEYIYDHRPGQLQSTKTEALFIGEHGRPIQSQTQILRLKQLQNRTGDNTLQEKEIGLHTLRHSIATHLLAGGMSIENISRFLGHSSLESTQVYTHLLDQPKPQPYNNIPKYESIKQEDDE